MTDSRATRVAIYARVSTKDQHCTNQIDVLTQWCQRQGHRITKVYTDAGISGSKRRDKRPGLDAALKDAARSFLEGLAPEDSAALLSFAYRVRLLSPAGPPASASAALRRLVAGGTTAIIDAVGAATALAEPGRGRPVPPGTYGVVLTVGDEQFTQSLRVESDPSLPASEIITDDEEWEIGESEFEEEMEEDEEIDLLD